MFCIGFTARQADQVKTTSYGNSAQLKKIRAVMEERDETKRMMVILKQGAEILEGQLRSLDVRFMQLRGTLDWHTHHARDEMQACSREFVRLSAEIEGFREKWNAAEDKIRNLQFEAKKKAQALKRRESQVHAMKKAQSMQLEAKSPRSDGVVKAEEKQQASDLDSQLDDEQQKGATTKMKSEKSI